MAEIWSWSGVEKARPPIAKKLNDYIQVNMKGEKGCFLQQH